MMGSSTTLVGRSILVVEDEAMIAFSLKELFGAEGAIVHIASSLDDALSLMDDIVISAAIIDFGSSSDDGGRLCRTLRTYGIPFMYYTVTMTLRKDDGGRRRLRNLRVPRC
jgi:DNA-binding response OmpR family regulator